MIPDLYKEKNWTGLQPVHTDKNFNSRSMIWHILWNEELVTKKKNPTHIKMYTQEK